MGTTEGILTAGHCSDFNATGEFYTCATYDSSGDCNYNFGPVDEVWEPDNDFEFIKTTGSGYAWDDNFTDTVWSITGDNWPVTGGNLTTDAYTDDVIHNIYVQGVGGCFTENAGGLTDHSVCDDVVLTFSSPICAAGDSGGLIAIVDGHGNVTMEGMINARSSSNGVYYCYGQEIKSDLTLAGATLVTGPVQS
jgi:hypothetical protein